MTISVSLAVQLIGKMDPTATVYTVPCQLSVITVTEILKIVIRISFVRSFSKVLLHVFSCKLCKLKSRISEPTEPFRFYHLTLSSRADPFPVH